MAGGQFFAGRAAAAEDGAARFAGSIADALHARTVARIYGVPAALRTDLRPNAWLLPLTGS